MVQDERETPSTIIGNSVHARLKCRLRSSETTVYDGLKYAPATARLRATRRGRVRGRVAVRSFHQRQAVLEAQGHVVLDGAFADRQALGDLCVGQAFELRQHEGFARLVRQAVQHGVDGVQRLQQLQALFRRQRQR